MLQLFQSMDHLPITCDHWAIFFINRLTLPCIVKSTTETYKSTKYDIHKINQYLRIKSVHVNVLLFHLCPTETYSKYWNVKCLVLYSLHNCCNKMCESTPAIVKL